MGPARLIRWVIAVLALGMLILTALRDAGPPAPPPLSPTASQSPLSPAASPSPGRVARVDADAGRAELARLFRERRSGVVVEGSGTVLRVLPDDRDGSPHQRFLLELGNGQSLLVSHNIELAARLDGLGVGDRVEFRGQYEWNDRGGVLHWTHHDPGGRRPGGWLRHEGREVR